MSANWPSSKTHEDHIVLHSQKHYLRYQCENGKYLDEVEGRIGDSAEAAIAVVVEVVVENEVAIGMQIMSRYVRDLGHVVASFPLVLPLVSTSYHESYPNPVSVMQKEDQVFFVLPSRSEEQVLYSEKRTILEAEMEVRGRSVIPNHEPFRTSPISYPPQAMPLVRDLSFRALRESLVEV